MFSVNVGIEGHVESYLRLDGATCELWKRLKDDESKIKRIFLGNGTELCRSKNIISCTFCIDKDGDKLEKGPLGNERPFYSPLEAFCWSGASSSGFAFISTAHDRYGKIKK